MALFKCKMCGGELDVHEGMTVTECPYCGTKQTLPRLDDEKRANLYDRADHFRRGNEFDKAADIYEKILEEDKEDAEAYWSLVLCRYGVEYVEDPPTHKRVPTINRAQYTSVLIDEDYLSAIKYADGYQRDVYETEAKEFDEIQKGILEISNKEEPFDVFICYKETDEQGRRSHDSVYAQDLYDNLTNEGYKVFFSRITLEDKLGTAYEPYIFAALNSAKVMIVIGTSENNFNAVWVKNEWSRYLTLIKKGEDKTLIPVYKDMDPYDLPEEFAYLQAQDMSKVGFMQDLIRSIKKLISDEVIDERQKKSTSSVIVDTMMRRATDALANGEWDTANRCYDSILDYDSKNVDAYLGKLMADCRVSEQEKLSVFDLPLDTNKNYQVLMDLADDELKETLENVNTEIIKKIKTKKNKKIKIIVSVIAVIIIMAIIGFFSTYYFYPLSVYNNAMSLCEEGNYKDSYDLIESIDSMTVLTPLRNKFATAKIEIKYQEALNLMDDGKYDPAQSILKANPEYKDSQNLILECMYQQGIADMENSRFDSALTTFATLSSEKYKDSDKKLDEARTGQEKSKQEDLEKKYQYVLEHENDSTNKDGSSTFYKYISFLKQNDYKDSESIYNSVYSNWKFKCWVNDSLDSENSKTSIAHNDSLYVHVKCIGGPVNKSVDLKFVYYNYDNILSNGYEKSFESQGSVYSFSHTTDSIHHQFYSNESNYTKGYVEIYNTTSGSLIDTIYYNY